MRALAQVVLAAAELHDDLLLALAMLLDRGRDLGTLEQRRADLDVAAVADEQDFAEFDRRARIAREALHLKDGALLDPILFAARGDDRVHRRVSKKPFGTKALSRVPSRRDAHSTDAPQAGQSLNKPVESTP